MKGEPPITCRAKWKKKNLNKKPQNGLGGGGMSAVQELRRLTQEDAVNSTLVWSV